jgi:hypothetical protein
MLTYRGLCHRLLEVADETDKSIWDKPPSQRRAHLLGAAGLQTNPQEVRKLQREAMARLDAHGLSGKALDGLLFWFAFAREPLPAYTQKHYRANVESWHKWVDDVLSISVQLRPGGRAIMRQEGFLHRVEASFLAVQRRRGSDQLAVKSYRVIAEGERGLLGIPIEMAQYGAALELAVGAPGGLRRLGRVPRARPRAGQPFDIDFYRRLIGEFDRLSASGLSDPAAELARRYGEKRSTVRSWLHRGRKYLREESAEGEKG